MIDDHDVVDEQLRAWGQAGRDRAAEVDVRAILAHTVDRPDLLPVTAGARRTRVAMRPVLIGAAVVVLAAGGGVAVHSLRTQSARSPVTGTTATPRDAHALVLRDGDTVRVDGEVLAVPKRPVHLCAPYFDSVGGDQFTYCPGAVEVTGVDLSALSDRQVSDGTVYGTADLIGIYRAGKVTVTRQSSMTRAPLVSDDHVPCPAPAGGWPIGAKDENIDMTAAYQYQRAHPGTIIDSALLRPSERQTVAYVLTDGDPAVVRAALTPDFGKRLCVTRSTWSRAQLSSALAAMHRQMNGPAVLTSAIAVGESLTAAAQLQVNVDIPTVSPALADVLNAQPHGIISLDVWLAPT